MPNTSNVSQLLTKNKVKKYLDETPIKDLTPNDQMLRDWNMSKKRFTQIKHNAGEELRFSEARQIADWLNSLYFPELKPWELYDFKLNGKLQSDE